MRGRFPIRSVRVIFPQSIVALLLLPVCFGVGAAVGVRAGTAFLRSDLKPGLDADHAVAMKFPSGMETSERDSFQSDGGRELLVARTMQDGTYPDMPQQYQLCEDELEKAAKLRQAACLAAPLKASSHWLSFDQAESETIDLLQAGNFGGIGRYIACDAVDLTIYEAYCDADLNNVEQHHIEQVLESVEPRVLAAAHWSREESPSREWLRSRLVSPFMMLGPPWSPEQQPAEGKTLLLLERQKDGKIYVSGVPITGIASHRAKPLD